MIKYNWQLLWNQSIVVFVELVYLGNKYLDMLFFSIKRWWLKLCLSVECCGPRAERYDIKTKTRLIEGLMLGSEMFYELLRHETL